MDGGAHWGAHGPKPRGQFGDALSDLFRKQAIDQVTRRLEGDVVLASPLSTRLLSGVLVAIVLGALSFAALGTYARRETVPGWVVPEGGLVRVAAKEGGVVKAIRVSEGADVAAGAALADLRLSTDTASGDSGEAIEHDLNAEADAAAAQVQASRAKLAAQRSELTARRAVLSRQAAELRGRVGAMQTRQHLAEAQVDRGGALQQKGFLSQQAFDDLRSAALSAAQETSQTREAVLEIERQMSDIDGELRAAPADFAAVAAQAAQSRAGLAQRLTNAHALNAALVTAPVAGRVAAIPVAVGQTVAAGGAVVVVIPKGSQLIAELYAPSKAIGFVRPGQAVRLMYKAFPYQVFGVGRGVVVSVSQTVLAPADVAIPGLSVAEPVFRVRVKLDRASVQAYGRPTPLQPGMLLSADIELERRSLLRWLLDPLYAAGRRS